MQRRAKQSSKSEKIGERDSFCILTQHAGNGGVNFEVAGAKFSIFALTYNVQFWSYEHVVNMFLVSFDLKKHLGTLSERSEHQK